MRSNDMRILSSAFTKGGEIPVRNTQEGEDLSPELIFECVPSSAKSLVLIADDPDAPDPEAPKTLWLHWLVINLPPETQRLGEGVKELPGHAVAARNDSGETGWSGPRPPIGTHRYFFTLYALDTVLGLPKNFNRADVERAMDGHVIEKAQTFGTYRLLANR